ncbi:MAG: GNAT family N-acetyltransferase [Treponema sp.]|nr:GNAT family N-acetyltransferase [Treponema sp.]
MIRRVTIKDAAGIQEIYNYYVENTAITFEEKPAALGEMETRIRGIGEKYPWFIREDDGDEVLGYAYANAWKERPSYRYSAELSIYVRNGHQGKGIGGELMTLLLEELRKTDIHALISGITLPNEQSVALHERFGFRNIACFREIGFKLGKWLDVGYWELIL